MLLVPTKIGPSKIQGIGLFAAKPIKKGTIIWKFSPDIDLVLTSAMLKELSSMTRAQILKYAYKDSKTKKLILCGDDSRFFNHSNNANVVDNPKNSDESVAIRDIFEGEELTCNYYSFDLLAKKKL